MDVLRCEWCGKRTKARSTGQVFCSTPCRRAYWDATHPKEVQRRNAMMKMREEGYTFPQIAKAFGVSKQRVAQLCPTGKRGVVGTCSPVSYCKLCGKVIRGDLAYCNEQCEYSHKWPEGETTASTRYSDKFTCAECGEDFERVQNLVNIGRNTRKARGIRSTGLRFCKQDCYFTYIRKHGPLGRRNARR